MTQIPSAEFKLLRILEPYLNYRPSKSYPKGIGDDAVVRRCREGERIILTADSQIEGVHFLRNRISFREIGYRAMAVNLSDCAAMGAQPDSALVQMIFPRKVKNITGPFREIYRGFHDACVQWKFPIVGGDIASGPCWIIAITLLGRKEKKSRDISRTGIRPGDALWVTGNPGASAAGRAALEKWGRSRVPGQFRFLVRAHIAPIPRIEAGKILARNPDVHAMIDVSDGISKECHALAFRNAVGLLLQKSLPLRNEMIQLGDRLHRNPLDWFLHGGEDYELLFAAAPGFDPNRVLTRCGVHARKIGMFRAKPAGVHIESGMGKSSRIPVGSWDHITISLHQSASRL
jgi:thiamine-monophosphate kinase